MAGSPTPRDVVAERMIRAVLRRLFHQASEIRRIDKTVEGEALRAMQQTAIEAAGLVATVEELEELRATVPESFMAVLGG